jgi:hypothetical protein
MIDNTPLVCMIVIIGVISAVGIAILWSLVI